MSREKPRDPHPNALRFLASPAGRDPEAIAAARKSSEEFYARAEAGEVRDTTDALREFVEFLLRQEPQP